ncbi:AsmA family protein, partial [Pseudomonas sp. SIMBA_077]
YIDGTANMASEQLDLTITPESKGLRLFSLRSPLYVQGKFIQPSAGVKAVPLVLRGAGMVALGVIAGPAAGLLALVAPSGDEPN